jgi:hypothetical protein
MSKTEAKQPCSSCPSSKSEPSGKNGKYGQLVLEVEFAKLIKDLQKDENIKISSVNYFMGKVNMKNFSFHGELQHRLQNDGASLYVLSIFYENLKNKKDIIPNYLEIQFLQRKKSLNMVLKQSNNCSCPCPTGQCLIYCKFVDDSCQGACGSCSSSALVTNSVQGKRAGATLAPKKLGGELKTEIVAVAPGTTYFVEIKNKKLKFFKLTAGAPNPRSV